MLCCPSFQLLKCNKFGFIFVHRINRICLFEFFVDLLVWNTESNFHVTFYSCKRKKCFYFHIDSCKILKKSWQISGLIVNFSILTCIVKCMSFFNDICLYLISFFFNLSLNLYCLLSRASAIRSIDLEGNRRFGRF